MGIEKFFSKDSYCGEVLFGGCSAGYTINVNPEKRVNGTVKGIARLIQNPTTTNEEIDYCLKVNSERLGIDQGTLMSMALESINGKSESKDSDSLNKEEQSDLSLIQD